MEDSLQRPKAERPAHVPPELVREFDFYNIPGSSDDVHAAYHAIQAASPDIFWTPYNGGHWVAVRADDIEEIQRGGSRFSNRRVVLPKMPDSVPRQIPLELDAPDLAHYRKPLVQAMMPSAINALEAGVRKVAIDTIERLVPLGECEFIESFAKVLPIHVFLDLVDLPLSDKDFLLGVADKCIRGRTTEDRVEATAELGEYLHKWIEQRRANPGTDLLSNVVTSQIRGELIGYDEAMRYATLILFGGLDTVASMMGFVVNVLARHPEHRRKLLENLDDDAFMNNAVEELLRRHGVALTSRTATHDFEFRSLAFLEGDMILPANVFVGLDERRTPNSLSIDLEREKPSHAVFGNGAHACPGAILARREIRIFLEEWLRRIPDFQIKPGTKPVFDTGMVSGVLELWLSWPAAKS